MDSRFVLQSSSGTDVGRRRKNNEDAFLVDDELGLWVVADGMGGQAAGEIASQQAVETVHGMVRRGLLPLREASGATAEEQRAVNPERVLESAVQGATYMVFGLAEMDQTKSGMGTTVSAMLQLGDELILAQVGDSRIYRVRDGQAEQLTEDHTLVNWQLQQGMITPEEAKQSKQRNVITRAVGNRDYVQVDILRTDIAAGDLFILCSDGLYAYLRRQELPGLVERKGQAAVRALIALANERGGKDNITCVLVEALEAPSSTISV